jgi:hypothetical protein
MKPSYNTSLSDIDLTQRDKAICINCHDDLSILKEYQKIVLERIQKSKSNPERMLDWDEASKSLKSLQNPSMRYCSSSSSIYCFSVRSSFVLSDNLKLHFKIS